MEKCPSPALWMAWSSGILASDERARWVPHLASCDACRAELASFTESVESEPTVRVPARLLASLRALVPAPRPRVLPWAAAAGIVLAVGLAWRAGIQEDAASGPPVSPPLSASRPGSLIDRLPGSRMDSEDQEVAWCLGASRSITLAPRSLLRREGEAGRPVLSLDRGEALVETAGEPTVLLVADMPGRLELEDAAVRLSRARPAPMAVLLREAWAAGEPWGFEVLRGEAVWVEGASRTVLKAGVGRGSPVEDSLTSWTALPGSPWRIRDGFQRFPGEPRRAECLVRKIDPQAETAVVFTAAGRPWEFPLGSHLPASRGWLRIRIEREDGWVRLTAGDRELFAAPASGLGALAYPGIGGGGEGWGIRAWGGDVEIREARHKSP